MTLLKLFQETMNPKKVQNVLREITGTPWREIKKKNNRRYFKAIETPLITVMMWHELDKIYPSINYHSGFRISILEEDL